jgi:hypothetical protein
VDVEGVTGGTLLHVRRVLAEDLVVLLGADRAEQEGDLLLPAAGDGDLEGHLLLGAWLGEELVERGAAGLHGGSLDRLVILLGHCRILLS